MEKRIQKLILLCTVLAAAATGTAQTPSVIEHIRIPLWAETDAYPELAEAQNTSAGVYDYPVKRLRMIAPFLITGMVNGWNFTYTPSDKLRGVTDFFDFSYIQPLGNSEKDISYTDSWIQDGKFNCWVEFTRTQQMLRNYELWASINNPVISGKGYGKIENGFDGIIDASKEALKDAVRSYFRGRIKDKPKEITGKVLIKNQPSIGIDAGRYIVQLDFFLETDRIIPYTQY
ncbi:MAG: hypothetical protein M0P01_07555 [Treponema sp.]|nr:hypothetical protein [Treponema sp.]